MTDHTRPGLPARMGLLAPAVLAVALLAGGCGDQGSDRASDSPSAASTTDSPSADATSTSADPTVTDSATAGEASTAPSIAAGVDLDGAVEKAVKADFPALIASRVPTGWTLTSVSFRSGTWDLAFTTADGGTAGVTQAAGSAQDLLDQRLGAGATSAGTVDLSRFGTGVWDAAQGSDAFGVTHAFHGTNAIVYAATQAEAETLAQQLLTAEDGTSPDGD